VRGGPRRSRGFPGAGLGRKSLENLAKNPQPDCLQVPRTKVKVQQRGRLPGSPNKLRMQGDFTLLTWLKAVPPGIRGQAGYLKAVWPEIFGPVFPDISAEIDPPGPP